MSFWLLPLFAGVAFVFAAGLHESLLWFLFYLNLACICLTVIYRWRRWSSLDISRDFNTEATTLEAGASLLVILRIQVLGILPWPWIEIEDGLPASLLRHMGVVPKAGLVWGWRGRQQYATYRIHEMPRGIHVWDSLKYVSGDPLNFVTYRGRMIRPAQLMVYPRTIDLPALKYFPRRVEGVLMPKQNFHPSQTQIVGVRDYQPGDRLGLIHWKSTAKTGQLQSKEFEPLLMNYSLVILDCSSGTWLRDYDPAFEEAVTVAASLLKATVALGIPACFLSNFTKQREQIPVTTRAEYYNLLGLLAAIKPDGRDNIASLLHRELFVRDNNIVFISSQRGTLQRSLLHRLSSHGNSVTLIVVNSAVASKSSRLPQPRAPYVEYIINRAEDLTLPAPERGVN